MSHPPRTYRRVNLPFNHFYKRYSFVNVITSICNLPLIDGGKRRRYPWMIIAGTLELSFFMETFVFALWFVCVCLQIVACFPIHFCVYLGLLLCRHGLNSTAGRYITFRSWNDSELLGNVGRKKISISLIRAERIGTHTIMKKKRILSVSSGSDFLLIYGRKHHHKRDYVYLPAYLYFLHSKCTRFRTSLLCWRNFRCPSKSERVPPFHNLLILKLLFKKCFHFLSLTKLERRSNIMFKDPHISESRFSSSQPWNNIRGGRSPPLIKNGL